MTVHRGRFTPADRAESVYHYRPVDLPPHATLISATLAYDTTAGVLDLGCFGPDGFRGWSGGARTRFEIGRWAATPGYLPGPLEPGTWHVALGLHRVGTRGVDYEITVEVGTGGADRPSGTADAEARPRSGSAPLPRRDVPAPAGMRWLAGDLHTHTVHSDGVLRVDQLATLAAERGLDFLAITDHNTTSHHRELRTAAGRAAIIVVPGQEITTASGHANAFGDIGWVDFRRPPGDWVRDVRHRGGLLSINHPVSFDCAWRHPLTERPPLAEVWHSSWRDRRDGAALAWWQAWGTDVIPIGGSDWHRPGDDARPGSPTTWVACTDNDILGGLAAGRTAINAGYHAPLLVRVDTELIALEAEGTTLVCPSGRRTLVRSGRTIFADHPGPHLLENDDCAVIALAA